MGLKNLHNKWIQLASFPLIIFILFVLHSCGGASPDGPLNLPVPFSGALTSDTNLLIASGNPVGGNSPLNLSIKNQAQVEGNLPISWELFDSNSGIRGGTVTFNSISNIEVQPFQSGGERRTYNLDYCASIGDDLVACASQAECFDYPSPYTPSTALTEFASSLGGTAELHKIVCSGNIDNCPMGDCPTGQLLDLKSLVGLVRFPDDTLQFHSQEDSAVLIHGVPFLSQPGNPDRDVLFTVIVQGFVEQLPARTLPEGVPPLPSDAGEISATFSFPVVEKGTGRIVGVGLNHLQQFVMVSGEEISFTGIVDFIFGENFASTGIFNADLGDNFSRIPNVTFRAAIAPELNEAMDFGIREFFLDDPNFNEAIFTENGGNATFPTVSETEPVRCSQPGQSAGIFEESCQEFGELRVEFRCLTKINGDPFAFFTAQGIWIFSRP